MTMNLNVAKFTNYQEKRKAFAAVVKDEKATDEQRSDAFNDMYAALGDDAEAYIAEAVSKQTDEFLNQRSVDAHITNEEVKFFNDINKEVGTKNDILLPETTVNEIMNDLTTEHPLLDAIGIVNNGIRLKFMKSNPKGVAVWGSVFDEIKGQLDSQFTEESAEQSKLTAFVVVPKDVSELGAAWIKQFVITQIVEAFAAAAEAAFLNGTGKSQPIGLTRQVQEGVAVTGGEYPMKADNGTLTFADPRKSVDEVSGVLKALSFKEKKDASGNPLSVTAKGNTYFVVNPADQIDIEKNFTFLNAAGAWVTSMPFGIQIIASEFTPANKLVAFVKGRYAAITAGGINIKQFDQTLALEDMDLFTAKNFFYGKAEDDNAAKVYALKIDPAGAGTPTDDGNATTPKN